MSQDSETGRDRNWCEEDPANSFHGDRAAAIARLRRLVEIGSEKLAIHALNLASYNLSTYLDVTLQTCGEDGFGATMARELDNEQRILKRRDGIRLVKAKRSAQG